MTAFREIVVILPSYNGEQFIETQICSILDQSHSQFKLHVFDDCSSDSTPEIVSALSKRDNRVVLHLNADQKGVIRNVSDALAAISADVYFLADQDDEWVPDKMEKQLSLLSSRSEVMMCFSNLQLIDPGGNDLGTDFWRARGIQHQRINRLEILVTDSIVTGCTMAFKREILELALPISDAAHMHDHWLSIFAVLKGKVVGIEECLVRYRQHENNVIGTFNSEGDRRQNQLKQSDNWREFRDRKRETYHQNSLFLSALDHRLKQAVKSPDYIRGFSRFYEALSQGKLGKTLFYLFNPTHTARRAFLWKVFLIDLLYPYYYYLCRPKGI